ncbi:MAG: CatB-related O-acetyltransferase [Chitinophagaceae bacterium]|nr:CatB-related O-acetyltransferase [Chitinophagaceae bacterium]
MSNLIRSTAVSIDAIQGHDIEIYPKTIIDKESEINSYSFIGSNCSITKAKIGYFASIANNVSIGMGEHRTDSISTSSLFYKDALKTLTERECVIGNDDWIGVDCIVLRGVQIGDGAVIGANSVVTKDIPDYAIAVGSPARVIKHRFNDVQQKTIKDSKWWLHNLEEAKKIHENILRNL